jgi:Ras-related protein Rab-1A
LFDITNKESFDNIRGKWFEQVKNNKPKDTCCRMLVGTKCDMANMRKVSHEDAKNFAQEFSSNFIETSAKVSTNVTQMFNMVAHDVVKA